MSIPGISDARAPISTATAHADALPVQQRLPALDGVRGVAIALVLAHNLQTLDVADPGFARLVERLLNLGWVGVQLFFALSGFLITRILIQARGKPGALPNFMVRRALRIFPIYYLCLAVLVLLPVLGIGPDTAAQPPTWPYWFYVSNWTTPTQGSPALMPHLWSLAVEEQFYLLWPLLVLGLPARWIPAACLATAAGSLLVRIAMLRAGASPEALYQYTPCRLDALTLGALAAVVFESPSAARHMVGRANSLLCAGLAVLLAGYLATRGMPRTEPLSQTLGYSALAIGFSLLVLAAAVADREGVRGPFVALRHRGLCSLGFYSYAIYLFHKPLSALIGQPLLKQWGVASATHVGLSLAYVTAIGLLSYLLARASYRWIERPMLDRRPAQVT